MSKNSEVVELFRPDGEVIDYRRLSARIPEFREAFPAREGYRIEVEYLDPIEAKPGLRRLYEAAISAGKTPEEAGLPKIAGNKMVFRATLYSPEGAPLESGSALRAIYEYKDWEKGESAARNRLLAALGFAGDLLDNDEDGDFGDQGLKTGEPPEEPPAPAVATEPEAPAAEEDEGAGGKPTVMPLEEDAPEAAQEQGEVAPGPSGGAVTPALMRQLRHQAQLKGAEVPEVTSDEEAKKALKTLMVS